MRTFYLIRPSLLAEKLRKCRRFNVVNYRLFYRPMSSKVFWILTLKDVVGFNQKDIFLYVPFSCKMVEQIIYELHFGNDELLRFVTEKDFEDDREVKISELNLTRPLEEKGSGYQLNTTDEKLYIFKVDEQKFILHWFFGELIVSFAAPNGELNCDYVDFLAQENDKFA